MNSKLFAASILIVGIGLVAVFAGEPTKARGPQDLLVRQVKQIKGDLTKMSEQLDAIQKNQKVLQKKVDILISSKWEYRVESVNIGGTNKGKLTELMKRMGAERFEYIDHTAEGLYIFKRRFRLRAESEKEKLLSQ